MNETLMLLTWLIIKHFIIDFPLQTRYQYSNKGTYGHLGGLLHAGLHSLGTYAVFVMWYPGIAVILALIDGAVHYHIDWAKVNINKRLGWGPTTHEEFWWLLGLDQFIHSLTYILLVWIVTQ